MGGVRREVGRVVAALRRESGVDPPPGGTVQEITTAGGKATGLTLGDGSTIDADAVLVAVGAAPNIGLAERAGLGLGDGGVLSIRRCAVATPTSSPSVTSPPPSTRYSAPAS